MKPDCVDGFHIDGDFTSGKANRDERGTRGTLLGLRGRSCWVLRAGLAKRASGTEREQGGCGEDSYARHTVILVGGLFG